MKPENVLLKTPGRSGIKVMTHENRPMTFFIAAGGHSQLKKRRWMDRTKKTKAKKTNKNKNKKLTNTGLISRVGMTKNRK